MAEIDIECPECGEDTKIHFSFSPEQFGGLETEPLPEAIEDVVDTMCDTYSCPFIFTEAYILSAIEDACDTY